MEEEEGYMVVWTSGSGLFSQSSGINHPFVVAQGL